MKRAALVGTMLLVVTACGGSAASPDESGRLEIDLEEFAFNPSSIQLQAGEEVTLVLVNTGEKEHEMHVGREVATMDGAPRGFEHNFFADMLPTVEPMSVAVGMEEMEDMEGMEEETEDMEGMEEGEHAEHAAMVGFHVVLAPGETADMTFTVPEGSAGEWQLGCFEDDGAHWDDGMQGTLTVTEG